jgi:hypothetical protein
VLREKIENRLSRREADKVRKRRTRNLAAALATWRLLPLDRAPGGSGPLPLSRAPSPPESPPAPAMVHPAAERRGPPASPPAPATAHPVPLPSCVRQARQKALQRPRSSHPGQARQQALQRPRWPIRPIASADRQARQRPAGERHRRAFAAVVFGLTAPMRKERPFGPA